MKRFQPNMDAEWEVLGGTERSQAAVMALKPGDDEGGPNNRHRKSDQWLYVVSGRGSATVNGEEVPLEPGTLLLVEANERHEVKASGSEPLKTLNFYSPPEY